MRSCSWTSETWSDSRGDHDKVQDPLKTRLTLCKGHRLSSHCSYTKTWWPITTDVEPVTLRVYPTYALPDLFVTRTRWTTPKSPPEGLVQQSAGVWSFQSFRNSTCYHQPYQPQHKRTGFCIQYPSDIAQSVVNTALFFVVLIPFLLVPSASLLKSPVDSLQFVHSVLLSLWKLWKSRTRTNYSPFPSVNSPETWKAHLLSLPLLNDSLNKECET